MKSRMWKPRLSESLDRTTSTINSKSYRTRTERISKHLECKGEPRMSGKKVGVFGIYSTLASVENATDALLRAGFANGDISVLMPESLGGPKAMGTEKA